MDIQNAVEMLKNESALTFYRYPALNEAVKLAIAALEKQIPKKPEHDDGAWSICPACCGSVSNDTEEAVNHEISYCDHCGQALDWSDYNA